MAVIEIEDVYKEYEGYVALDDVSITVNEGLTLLLGPNGAGKTTLLKCIVGLLNFDGEIRVMGYDVRNQGEKVRRVMGYLPQKVSIYENMRCYEIVNFYSKLRGLSIDPEVVLQVAELEDEYYARFEELSGGMRQRFALALLLASDLPVLVLDEPLSNLDPMGRRKFESILKDLKENKTVLVSSHSIGGLLPHADRIIVMSEGRVVFEGDVDDFLSLLDEVYKVYIRTNSGWKTLTSKSFEELVRKMNRINEGKIKGVIFEEIPVDQIIPKIGGN